VLVVILIACALIFFALNGPARLGTLGFFGPTPTPTRTRTPASAPVTIIPVILNTPTPTTGPTPVTIKYKVKAGDTLSQIADRYHVPMRIIMAANGMKDETIRIGDDLLIPLPTPTPPPSATSPPGATPTPLSFDSPPSSADTAATPGVVRHSVQRGDTLIGIAAQYGSTVSAIRAANQLASDALSIGQTLIVPVGSWTPTPAPTPTAAPATPTSQFPYAAPSLKFPPDNQAFRGNKEVPTLEWLSPAILKPGEMYVAHVESGPVTSRKIYPSLTVRQGTSAKLDSSYYGGASAEGTVYSWYVVIVSQTQDGQMIAASPPSETRKFVWY
jgi:LysM repeat protein